MNQLGADLIRAGRPVPLDCYDGQGHLLLKKGAVIDAQRQVDFLLERGLFGRSIPGLDGEGDVALTVEVPSPFQLLDEYYNRLEKILASSEPVANALNSGEVAQSELLSAAQQLADLLDGKMLAGSDTAPKQVQSFPLLVLQLAKDIQALCQLDADAILGAIHLDDTGDRYSVSHPLNRAIVCELLAARRRIPERNRRQLIAAALTCDLSMWQLQDELTCQEGPLRPEQRQAIADHPHETVRLLAALGAIDPSWTNAVLQHHEFPNGKGYPAGLSGQMISPWARILKLADTYTAMISPQLYRKAFLSKAVLHQLFLGRGGEFDEDLAVFFVKELGVFPPGLFVELQSGELAVVIRRGANPRAPLVKAVIGPRGAPLLQPIPRMTDVREYEIVDVLERDAMVGIDLHSLWGYDT